MELPPSVRLGLTRLQLGKGIGTLFGIFSEDNRYDRNPDSLQVNNKKPGAGS